MKQVEVFWSTYLDVEDGETPEEAALSVKGTLQDPHNQAWWFTVIDNGKRYIIDASDDDEPTIDSVENA